MPAWRSTGTAERRASVLSAGATPPCDRIAGWMPREIRCSSSDTAVSPDAISQTCVLKPFSSLGIDAANPRALQTQRDEPLLGAIV